MYSSWSEYIHQCNVYGEEDAMPGDVSKENHVAFHLNPDARRFCVFSLCYSPDGREVLAG